MNTNMDFPDEPESVIDNSITFPDPLTEAAIFDEFIASSKSMTEYQTKRLKINIAFLPSRNQLHQLCLEWVEIDRLTGKHIEHISIDINWDDIQRLTIYLGSHGRFEHIGTLIKLIETARQIEVRQTADDPSIGERLFYFKDSADKTKLILRVLIGSSKFCHVVTKETGKQIAETVREIVCDESVSDGGLSNA